MINFDTIPTDGDPQQLINSINHTRRQHDSKTLLAMMEKVSGEKAVLWAGDVIGFGRYHYTYKTGRQGYWPLISFTPSLQSLMINVMTGFTDYEAQLKNIGKAKLTENAMILYTLSDVNRLVLENFLQKVFDDMQANKNND